MGLSLHFLVVHQNVQIGKKYGMHCMEELHGKMIKLTGAEVHDWIVMTKGNYNPISLIK